MDVIDLRAAFSPHADHCTENEKCACVSVRACMPVCMREFYVCVLLRESMRVCVFRRGDSFSPDGTKIVSNDFPLVDSLANYTGKRKRFSFSPQEYTSPFGFLDIKTGFGSSFRSMTSTYPDCGSKKEINMSNHSRIIEPFLHVAF